MNSTRGWSARSWPPISALPCKLRAMLDLSDVPEIPQRPPNLCAGCSHRATFYAVKKAAEGMQTIYPTDIGCYTLGFLPPLSMGDFLICMGSSAGTSCGFSKVTDKKVVSFIGDSTFFHSGIPGLVNAVFNNHNFTFVILDNGITAMTGHQPNPGVDMGLMNLSGIRTDLDRGRCPGAGRCPCCGHSALQGEKEHRSPPRSLQFQRGIGRDRPGNVHPVCQRALKKPESRAYYVSDKCRNHRDCISQLACPAFYLEAERVKIDPVMCAGCAVCAQICPENAILPVKA